MECTIRNDGSWTAKVVGCKTPYGRSLLPGEQYTETGIVSDWEIFIAQGGKMQI